MKKILKPLLTVCALAAVPFLLTNVASAQQPQPSDLGNAEVLLLCNRRLGQPARAKTSPQALSGTPKTPLDGRHLPKD